MAFLCPSGSVFATLVVLSIPSSFMAPRQAKSATTPGELYGRPRRSYSRRIDPSIDRNDGSGGDLNSKSGNGNSKNQNGSSSASSSQNGNPNSGGGSSRSQDGSNSASPSQSGNPNSGGDNGSNDQGDGTITSQSGNPNSSGGNNGSNGQGGGNSSQNTTITNQPSQGSSSGDSKSKGFPPFFPFGQPPECVFCVHDNDPRILYSGAWTLNGPGSFNTTHSTTTPGSFLTFNFNGSGIIVLGTVPQSNETLLPPTASFVLDASPPFVTTQPLAGRPISNQPLFAMGQLDNVPHQLIINVTQTNAPFTLDYFIVFPPSNGSKVVGSAEVPPPSQVTSDADNALTVKLLSAFLGTIIFILLVIIGLLTFKARKFSWRKRTLSQTLPRSSFAISKRPSARFAETMFTSTESILRNNPSIMSSYWSGVGSEYLPSPAPPVRIPSEKSPLYPIHSNS